MNKKPWPKRYVEQREPSAVNVYADDLISMTRGSQTRWYHFDGLGSTRLLTDESGAATDTYSYDAFGNPIARTGTTQNDFLFTGQQRDANAGFYYLRARWMDPGVGLFVSLDPFAGEVYAPPSLHKYAYVTQNPVNRTDPSGLFPKLVDYAIFGTKVHQLICDDFKMQDRQGRRVRENINMILGTFSPLGIVIPDLVDTRLHQVYEIKPDNAPSRSLGLVQLAGYLYAMNKLDPDRNNWGAGFMYRPKPMWMIGNHLLFVSQPELGIIVYTFADHDMFKKYHHEIQRAIETMVQGVIVAAGMAVTLAALGYR